MASDCETRKTDFDAMELTHSLTLNEDAYKKVPDQQKPVFLFEWLRYLDRVLVAAQKVSSLRTFLVFPFSSV